MKQSDLEAAQTGSTTRLSSIESKQSDYEQALTFCGDEIKDIKGKLDELVLLRDKLSELEENQAADNDRVRQLQSNKSLKTLMICGIPKTHNEDLTYIISKLANQISCSQVNKSDLETVFRPKNSNQSPSTTIVVRFSSLIKRDEFYNCRKLLGKNTLSFKARQSKTDLKYQYVWTHHGQIFMRKTKESDMVKVTDDTIFQFLS